MKAPHYSTPFRIVSQNWKEMVSSTLIENENGGCCRLHRLGLIYLGKSLTSLDIHEKVIRSLEDDGPDSPQILDLRKTAP